MKRMGQLQMLEKYLKHVRNDGHKQRDLTVLTHSRMKASPLDVENELRRRKHRRRDESQSVPVDRDCKYCDRKKVNSCELDT